MPSTRAWAAVSRAMPPKPTRPSTLPDSSRPAQAARGQSPAIIAAFAPYARRRSVMAVPSTYSETDSVLAPVAG